MIGIILSTCINSLPIVALTALVYRIRAAVRGFDTDYDWGKFPHARCFYKDEEFDLEDPEKGFLHSHLLLQVRQSFAICLSSTEFCNV